MNDLDEAIENICRLKGEAMAVQCMLNAILRTLPPALLAQAMSEFDEEAEAAKVHLLNSDRAGEYVIAGFDTYVHAATTRFPY